MAESILFVDDDGMILNALERTFLDTEYDKFFALDTNEALKILEKEKIDLLISDIKISPLSGCQFLNIVREKFPSVIRIILSAYEDKHVMMKTIYEGLAKVYMLKPWDNKGLLNEVDHLLKMYRSIRDTKLLNLISGVKNLPMIPGLYGEVAELVKNDGSLEEISKVIEHDQVCAAKLLKLANSAFYGISMGSIHKALVYLGIKTINDLILVSGIFLSDGPEEARVDRQLLFDHVNTCSRILHGLHMKFFGRKISEEYACAALLHDIGRMFILCNFPQNYKAVMSWVRGEGSIGKLGEIEKSILGYSHERIGVYILDWWNLPAYIVEAAYCHHDPYSAVLIPKEIIALIYTADMYAWEIIEKVRCVGDIVPGVFEVLKCTPDRIGEYVDAILNKTES